jgi:hypothetical protein
MKVQSVAILLAGAMSLHAQTQLPVVHHSALTVEQVTRSLSKAFADKGIQVTEQQVSLPTHVVILGDEAVLEVKSIEPLGHLATGTIGEVGSAVKMTCAMPSKCLPFYAIVALPAGTDLRGNTAHAVQSEAFIARKTASETVIKAGTPATLVMDDSVAHLKLSVVALQNGSVGQTIRVSSPDHKQNYTAEVVSANIVKGAF